jgi:hypothetical protein
MILLLALFGCPNAEESDAPLCDATVTAAWPGDGALVARDAAIRLEVTGTASAASFALNGEAGAIDGAVSIAGSSVTFTPTAPLPGRQTFTWSAEVCGQSAGGTFVTGSLEAAREPASLVGSTYTIDLSNATWVKPEGGGDLVEQAFGGVFLVGVQAADAVSIDAILAAGTQTESGAWQQDPCFATVDFEPSSFTENPYFFLDAERIETSSQGMPVIIRNANISGGFDVDAIVDAKFSGEVDLRDYREQFGSNGCALVEAYAGISCEACSEDGKVECILLEAEDVTADLLPGLTVVRNENPEECATN